MVNRLTNFENKQEEEGVTTLIGNIIDKAHELFTEQLALFRAETAADLIRTKEAATMVGVGAVFALPATFMLCLTLAHLIFWFGAPVDANPPTIPLWVCYLIVTLLTSIASAFFIAIGVKRFQSFNPLPNESADALVENIQCLTKKI